MATRPPQYIAGWGTLGCHRGTAADLHWFSTAQKPKPLLYIMPVIKPQGTPLRALQSYNWTLCKLGGAENFKCVGFSAEQKPKSLRTWRDKRKF